MGIHAVWFHNQGIGVFPIKTRSKEPACKSWDDYACTSDDAAKFTNYGVRLSTNYGVIDTDSPESEAWVQAHCPHTPFIVEGARGLHRYYRLMAEHTPKFIKRDGLTIEFRNQGQYVVGPGSIHPTGKTYEPRAWSWRVTDLTIFPRDFVFDEQAAARGPSTNAAYEFPDEVSAGERHDALYKLLRQQKALGLDKESTWELVKLANDNRCQPPLKDMGELRRWFNRGFDAADRPMPQAVTHSFEDMGFEL